MAPSANLELYGFWRSQATFRVRVALRMKGLSSTEHSLDLDLGEQLRPEFLEINPMGAVPALVEPGSAALTQSLAILEYLDEVHPTPALLAGSPRERARVRSIASMFAGDLHPLLVPRVRKYLTEVGKFDDRAWRAWATNWYSVGLNAAERRLSMEPETGRFCHGDAPGLADICLASSMIWAHMLKIELSPTPTLDRIVASCMALEPFQKAHPLLQPGAPNA